MPRARLFLPLAYMCLIFVLSSIPGEDNPNSPLQSILAWLAPVFQNLLHLPLFGGLALTWYWALHSLNCEARWISIWAFSLTGTYAVLDEWHQFYTPGRTASWMDLMLDLAGAGLALVLLTYYRKRSMCA